MVESITSYHVAFKEWITHQKHENKPQLKEKIIHNYSKKKSHNLHQIYKQKINHWCTTQ